MSILKESWPDANEPWTFEKHLVVFQRVDEDVLMTCVHTSKISFRVHVHNLPIHRVRIMNNSLYIEVSNTIQ
jgi:hypothetical protein